MATKRKFSTVPIWKKRAIRQAIKRGLKQYKETFRLLAREGKIE